MELIYRWLLRGLAVLATLFVIAIALIYYLISGSLPDYEAEYQVEGLSGPVEIVRDVHAVPHIFADAEADVFFGLGYAHAEDRLWQMEISRRTVQGRLSEMLGARAFEFDRLMRSLDLYRLATAAVDHQTPQTRAMLEAYSRGVNARLSVVARNALGRGAPEFLLFTDRIAPWTPADSIALTKLMALQLTGQGARESLRALLDLALPPERLRDLLPDYPDRSLVALPEYSSLFPGAHWPEPTLRSAALDLLPPPGFEGASNAFAADGTRTASGKPVLATDPHLSLTAPGIWMLAQMGFADGQVIGGTIPGIPAVVIGRNESFGWGLTTAYIDDQDIYIEKLNPDNPEEYLTPEGWRRFETRDVLIEVNDEISRTVTLRWTRHGPVIPGSFYGTEDITPAGHVAALAWTALTAEDRSIEALLRLMRSKSVQAAIPVIGLNVAPGQNVTMADATTIALQVAGRAPLRKSTHQGQGRLPVPGWVAQNDWEGVVPYSEMPRIVDPPGGIVVNTNNRTSDKPFPFHVSFDWGDTQRIRRAEKLLQGREFHSRDSFIEIQTDIVSETARTLLPLMLRDLYWAGQPPARTELERLRQQALSRLAEWNGEMNAHTPEPLLFAAWLRGLQNRLVVDELGALADRVRRPEPIFIERVLRNVDGASIWCDIDKTTPVESCEEIARIALDEALAGLRETFGERMESWRWGDAHMARMQHRVLGGVFPFSLLVNINLPTAGGDFTLLRGQMKAKGETPFANVHASGLRAVYDFSDPDASIYIIATGQSGHPLSRHYDDLSSLWRQSEYISMSLDPEAARGGAIGVTTLVPAE